MRTRYSFWLDDDVVKRAKKIAYKMGLMNLSNLFRMFIVERMNEEARKEKENSDK